MCLFSAEQVVYSWFELLLVENDEDREQSALDVILVCLSYPLPHSEARLRKRASPGCSAVSERLSLIGRAEHHQLINSIK